MSFYLLASESISWWQAILLGLLQGFTEFLPVSSSGHLEIGKALLGIKTVDNVLFTTILHGATVLSTILVFWKTIIGLFKGLFRFKSADSKINEETHYVLKLALSVIPVAIVGLFFKDRVEALFSNSLVLVGCMLLLTALLLILAQYLGSGKHSIRYKDAFWIGVSQALAVLPGLSRSGTTIATGLLLGNKKSDIAQFSFLMVLVPIIGENILNLFSGEMSSSDIPTLSLICGFIAAFISGCIACKLMIKIVKNSKLIYFAVYCGVVGLLVLFL